MKVSAACEADGKGKIEILSLAGTTFSALALAQDRADAIIVSTPTASSLIQATPDAYEAAGAPFDTDGRFGIAVAKDNPTLLTALNKAMKEIAADGTYGQLLARWKLPASTSLF